MKAADGDFGTEESVAADVLVVDDPVVDDRGIQAAKWRTTLADR